MNDSKFSKTDATTIVEHEMQQVERTERVLKTLWRERNDARKGWIEQYQVLESQSEQIRRTALIILKNLLS